MVTKHSDLERVEKFNYESTLSFNNLSVELARGHPVGNTTTSSGWNKRLLLPLSSQTKKLNVAFHTPSSSSSLLPQHKASLSLSYTE